jgi:hypothetical protein
VPGRLAKLAVAVSLLGGALRLRTVLRRRDRAAWPWRQRLAALRWLFVPQGRQLSATFNGTLGDGAPLSLTISMPSERTMRARWRCLGLLAKVRMLAAKASILPNQATFTQMSLASAARFDGITVTRNTDAEPGNQRGSTTP